MLGSLRDCLTSPVVVRNSDVAAGRGRIRLALPDPDSVNGVLGALSALFSVGVAAALNFVTPATQKSAQQSVQAKPQGANEEATTQAKPTGKPPMEDMKKSLASPSKTEDPSIVTEKSTDCTDIAFAQIGLPSYIPTALYEIVAVERRRDG